MNCRFCGGIPHGSDGDDWPLPLEWQECVRSHRRRIEELERRMKAMDAEEARHHARLPFARPVASQTQKPGIVVGPTTIVEVEPRLICRNPENHSLGGAHDPQCYEGWEKRWGCPVHGLNCNSWHESGVLTKAMEYEIAVKEGTLPVPGSEGER